VPVLACFVGAAAADTTLEIQTLSFGQIGFEDINWICLIQTMSNGGLL
jgi:hypothetical protein